MIIACGVLSCVAVLLGIIILEIAIDRKNKKKAQSQSDNQTENTVAASEKVETPVVAEEAESVAERPVEETIKAEEPAQTEELVKVEEPEEFEDPATVVVPASEPIIEEAPTPVEELVHVENIIAEEPAVVVSDEIVAQPAIEQPVEAEEPVQAEEPEVAEAPVSEEQTVEESVADEPAVVEEPVNVEEPVVVPEEQPAIEEPVVEPPVNVEEPAEVIIAEEAVIAAEPKEEPANDEQSIAEEPTNAEDVEEEPEEIEEPVDETEESADEPEEVASELKVVVKDGQTRYIVIKYSKSFEAKIIQSPDDTKRYYSELKNCLLSYGVKSNAVKSRMSWKWESFRFGRKTLAKLRVRGKTVSIVLALNPDDYKDTKYLVESVADVQCYADTPALYRIKSERRLKYTKELIAKMMQDNGLTQKAEPVIVDYASQYPYDTTENLIERKLIKVLTDEDAQSGEVFMPSDIRKSVKAQDVDNILQDEIAVELIEKLDGVSDKTKSGIINIDTLSQNFADGETVTIEEIRKRIKGYNKVTYIKVLARGTLDKRLTVEADDFSLQAVKMIVLIGGRVVKK